MADKTGIEWTDATWNPVRGCTKVSAGCDNCYAERVDNRWNGPGSFDTVRLQEQLLTKPLTWKRPRKVFVNSMSDLFHDKIEVGYIARVFAVMAMTPQHTYQILTKRHGRMRSLLSSADFWLVVGEEGRTIAWARERGKFPSAGPMQLSDGSSAAGYWMPVNPLPNVWLGVSVEDQQRAELRIPALLQTPAAVRFLSCEPLLGPVDLRNLRAKSGALVDCLGGDVKSPEDGVIYAGAPSVVDWVIVGGESGPGARPMHPDWARGLRDQCQGSAAFHFKQWGEWAPTGWKGIGRGEPGRRIYVGDPVDEHGHRTELARVGKKAAGRELDGRTWDEYPATATAVTR